MKTGYSFGSLVSFVEALNASAVKITGDQTIAGLKTFSSNPITSAAQGSGGGYLTRKDYVDGALALKAPLASPALTGVPTAPTAAVGTDTTQLATTAFVASASTAQLANVAPLMDGIAAIGTSTLLARQDHIHPTDTSRAPLDSPALTGIPTAPTAAAGANTTQIATTAFVTASNTAQLGAATPLMDGTAAVGTSTLLSRQDHKHPTDTSRAPLASPALTGIPTAPTAATGTNTTQLATTAFVTAANTAQVGTDTPLMNGTAAVGTSTLLSRQDHVHPTDTTRAPLASPALTGTPTAPTQTVGNNSTRIATTAFVQTAKESARTTTYTVADEAAMLALSNAKKGDLAIRSDLNNRTFILYAEPYSTLANWKVLVENADTSGYVLRSELGQPNGVALVGGALKQSDLVLQPITKIASYNNNNVTQAWKDSVASFGYVYFPGFSSALATYNIVGDDPLLHGTTVFVDDNVNLAFDYDYYPLIGSLDIHGHCKFSFTSKNFSTKGGKVDYVGQSARLNRFPLNASVVAFSDCKQWSINSDTWTQGSLGTSSASAVLVPLSPTITSGLFVPIDIGETISAHLKMNTGTATSLGVMLRCANGWIKLHRVPNSPGSWTYQVKQIGKAIVTGNAIPAPSNTLNSYSSGKASIGVSLTSRQTFRLIINGVAGYLPLGSSVGDIYEVGFFADGASSNAVARVTGLCSYKTADNKAHGAAPVHLAIYGDSTAEKWLSTFDMYLPQVIDGEMSCRSLSIQNFAVAGETFAQQFARLQANGPGQASIICMVAGTNEGQAGTSADAFAVQVQQFIDYCNANSRTPMLVEPWMWYSNTFISGAGQASANYDGVSELREAGKRVAVAAGAIYVSTTHELPAPLPEYFNSGLDPLLRDDIHQSELGYRLYAELIGSHIVEHLSRVALAGRNVPFYWANPAVVTSIGAESRIAPNGISVALSVNAFTNPSVVLSLPRWGRPDRPTVFTGMFTGAGGTYSACKVSYANGQLTVDGLTQTTATIYIDAAW